MYWMHLRRHLVAGKGLSGMFERGLFWVLQLLLTIPQHIGVVLSMKTSSKKEALKRFL